MILTLKSLSILRGERWRKKYQIQEGKKNSAVQIIILTFLQPVDISTQIHLRAENDKA